MAKAVVEPGFLIGREALTHIRERTTTKGAKNRRQQTKRAFAELETFVAYKAQLAGGLTITVDADYRSQGRPHCGDVSKRNRPNHGLTFVCKCCGFTLHADLVGARDGSNKEAKVVGAV
ncbi:MAG: transposase [Firmicutes bacterium]|nr:transposase [Bacillota bacterium]MCL5065761.1 transposase [Bacillota bacterium]